MQSPAAYCVGVLIVCNSETYQTVGQTCIWSQISYTKNSFNFTLLNVMFFPLPGFKIFPLLLKIYVGNIIFYGFYCFESFYVYFLSIKLIKVDVSAVIINTFFEGEQIIWFLHEGIYFVLRTALLDYVLISLNLNDHGFCRELKHVYTGSDRIHSQSS